MARPWHFARKMDLLTCRMRGGVGGDRLCAAPAVAPRQRTDIPQRFGTEFALRIVRVNRLCNVCMEHASYELAVHLGGRMWVSAMDKFGRTRPMNVLVVDDEPNIRRMLIDSMTTDGHRVHGVGNARDALLEAGARFFRRGVCGLLRLGVDSGMDLVPQLVAESPWMKVRYRHYSFRFD